MDPNDLLNHVGKASAGLMLWGMVWGSIGLGFFIYGKRQGRIVPLIVGIALSVLPFFVTDEGALIASGTALTILPWFLRGR